MMGSGPCTEKVVNGHNSFTLLKTNYLELLAVKCFLLFLHRCHVLMSCDSSTTTPDSSQVHSHSRNHYSLDSTQRTPAVSLFGGPESCSTAMEDSVDVTGISFHLNVKDKILTHLTVSLIYCSQWSRPHITS